MNILHYTLGLPPYRKGGLTKYVSDLIQEQNKRHTLFILYPTASFSLSGKGVFFERTTRDGIKVYKLKTNLPIPLLEGIRTPTDFIEKPEGDTYKKAASSLLKMEKIDLIHIHTLMGLPLSFIEEIKERGIKIIYTTHDYFGLCPKVNLITNRGVPCENRNDCAQCNQNAPSSFYLRNIRNSKLILSNRSFLDKLKKIKPVKRKNSSPQLPTIVQCDGDYTSLRAYYSKIFRLIDCFHFNSSVSRDIYLSFLPDLNYRIINITHADLKDNRKTIDLSNKVRIGFIGPTSPYKGYPLLIAVLNRLVAEAKLNWELYLGGETDFVLPENLKEKTHLLGSFSHKQMGSVFSKFDLLIMPSIWFETFGFVALEAISFGIPVLLSDTCGVKDIIQKITPELIIKMNEDTLYKAILSFLNQPGLIQVYNQRIIQSTIHFDIFHHASEMEELYQEILSNKTKR